LIQLSHEAVVHGSLENCSAWKFESFMQVLKKLVQSGKNPLAQVVKRIVECNFCPLLPGSNSSMKYSAESVTSTSPNMAIIQHTDISVKLSRYRQKGTEQVPTQNCSVKHIKRLNQFSSSHVIPRCWNLKRFMKTRHQ